MAKHGVEGVMRILAHFEMLKPKFDVPDRYRRNHLDREQQLDAGQIQRTTACEDPVVVNMLKKANI